MELDKLIKKLVAIRKAYGNLSIITQFHYDGDTYYAKKQNIKLKVDFAIVHDSEKHNDTLEQALIFIP